MLLSNLEYIPLRMLRRFILRDNVLLRFGSLIPYYRVNVNQVDPALLVDGYASNLAAAGFQPQGKRLLEIGVGRTNSVAYEMAARFAPQALTAVEPYVGFASAEDAALLSRIAERHHCDRIQLAARVNRLKDFREVPDASIDLVLSGSVLEHVNDPPMLFAQLHRILSPGGVMLHRVDYRDHFFKYPFHFLQFRKSVWNRWLNPGDLPVWRAYDHLEQLAACGFSARVLEETRDPGAFAEVASRVSADYRRSDNRLQTATAAIWAEKVMQ